MSDHSNTINSRKTARVAKQLAQPFSKRKLLHALHVMGPTLLALTFAGVGSGVAHAQGTMDFSGATTLMQTFKTFAIYAGAVICLGGLIFAGIRMMSGRFQDAIPGLFGALFGAGVLGWGAGWIGYTQEYLDASSLRSQQIKDEMAKKSVSGPRAAQIAAHSTRDKKQNFTREAVLEAHRGMAADYGNQPQAVVAEARERTRTQQHNRERTTRAKEAITYARDSLFEREAVAEERLIFRDALRRGMGETTYAEVQADFEARRERGEFRSVEAAKYASGRSFTTPETIAAERANIAYVVAGKNAVAPIMSAAWAQEQARSHDFFNDSQRRVIEEVLNSTDRIHGLQGRAGSGKTTVLASIREGAERSGYTVERFAPTSRAAAQLREAGIDATTLQSFLARGANHPSANHETRHLYMLDESSLASTRQMRSFLDKLNPSDRVLVIGDTSQHQGVDAGKPFEQMRDAGMRTSQLDRIMRQKDPELLKAVEQLAMTNTQRGIDMLASQGRISEIPDRHDRIAAIAKDYAATPENTIIVSPDNRSRQQINEAVRAELLQKGALSGDGKLFRTLSHRSDMTGMRAGAKLGHSSPCERCIAAA
jgi:molybdopterin-guanine dinucleotide biosynthesis protein